MKKICLLVVALVATTLQSYAQHRESENILERLLWDDKMLNIMIDTRVDFQGTLNGGDLDDLSFQGQTIKVWLVGEIVPGIRYRVRHRLNKPQTPLREGYSAATDQAWIALDAGKHWTFTIGKQSVQFGTFEYDYNPADIYLGTMTFNDLDAYKTGVDVAYKFAGQTLHLQVVNSDATQFASDEYKKKALAFATLWEGSLFDNILKTRWGYGAFQHTKSKFYNWITLGTQINVDKFTTEFDYYYGYRNMDYGYMVDNDSLGLRYVKDQSLSVNLKYDFGKWKPFVKGTWDQRYDKDFSKTAYESTGIQAVLEYYPFTNKYVKDLRFHLAYMYSHTDYKGMFSNLSDNDTHTFLVGTRWLFKAK
ncbi:hypothetical protein M2459_000220 [Parabacteroides sp. PF5-5]|uniref:porin n=1 Tax=unclassified Parabacteroides TaxID=2649774 RepID=UPI002474229E|nr:MULTISPECIES: porin [unclassified Parabacteroides]MDH6303888.1 hypothetical protein [Parabacteroides sp. PH5-39]MDH6314505.1 hypothetical protein [Parabacteroides sp. PF5-13]MDH6318430.1 hypothetical protein [Parabacteroides sp. PH5-13]MDH6322277.1 hypothetical protein [Parabacteroides sp. PH5-8]MDH6325643.1 hypothetical protein [Parabacteroides sp. PH5-41]